MVVQVYKATIDGVQEVAVKVFHDVHNQNQQVINSYLIELLFRSNIQDDWTIAVFQTHPSVELACKAIGKISQYEGLVAALQTGLLFMAQSYPVPVLKDQQQVLQVSKEFETKKKGSLDEYELDPSRLNSGIS